MIRISYTDKDGNTFKSLYKLCNHYNANYRTFLNLYKKYGVEKALEMSKSTKWKHLRYHNVEGKRFESRKSLCDYYGVSVYKYENRLAQGFTMMESLTGIYNGKIIEGYYDDKDNYFKTARDLCAYYNISENTFKFRFNHGLSIKDCLYLEPKSTISLKGLSQYGGFDYEGNYWFFYIDNYHKFMTLDDVCNYYDISRVMLIARLRSMSLKDAVTKRGAINDI